MISTSSFWPLAKVRGCALLAESAAYPGRQIYGAARAGDRSGAESGTDISVVIGHGADQLREALAEHDVLFALQEEQKGTGHAVAQAQARLGNGVVLVLYGDVPLIRRDTLANLLTQVDEQHMGLLTVTLDDPGGYGRIVRDSDGQAVAIVEQKRCQRRATEHHRVQYRHHGHDQRSN